MKALTLCVALALAVALASASDRAGWVEPSYAASEAVEGASFLEDGTRTGVRSKGRVRGISHTVSGHHGMVTYISPARHIQTSGIVLTPPPTVSVVSAAPPMYVQPVVVPHADYHYAVGHDHVHAHSHGHSHHHLPHLTADDVVEHVPHDSRHHSWGHHHSHGHWAGRVHVGSGVHAGDVHVHPYSPLAVPASLYDADYHQPHYGHDSPVSQGAILVPHGPEGRIALEEADYAGYNPGPAVQYTSVPTAYYSDGTPHRASINQRYN